MRIRIQPLPAYTKLLDKLMVPIMFVLRGFQLDSLQETHAWHPQAIDAGLVDRSLGVVAEGTDATRYHRNALFLFHAPIFGGWRNFSVYEVGPADVPFRIGWARMLTTTGEVTEAKVQRLLIHDRRVRMLDGPPTYRILFFALNERGEQVRLRKVGSGQVGDRTFAHIRLL